jgi:polyisoprenoid-binding protein YceI
MCCRRHRIPAFLLLALTVFTAAPAAQRPIPSASVRSGTLSFDGQATAGDFTGTTSTVSGEITGGASFTEVRGWVEAPVTALVTGNARRDRDLNKSMESHKYPKLRFELEGVRPEWERGDSAAVVLEGKLTIHGVTRPAAINALLHFQSDSIRVTSQFPMNLKDYRIGGLSKFLGVLKMHPDIVVHVDLTFGPKSS